MSEFQVRVVRIGPVRKHPNADALSITEVGGEGGYPCILRTGEFHEGDLAVYIPITALLPADDPRWAFLLKQGEQPPPRGIEVKAKRLRGVFSMGLLTKPDPGWEEGRDVAAELRIVRAEPAEPTEGNEPDPGLMPVYTDILGLRGNPGVLHEGEEVVILEKIHGECVARMTRITMADGSKRVIGDIHVGDAVLGVRDGACVPSLVTHVFRKPSPAMWWRVQGERRGAGRGNHFFKVQCTAEHRFWNNGVKRWVNASELKPGDKVLLARSDAGLTPVQEQVLLGKMLGDGSLADGRWSAQVQWCHAAADAGYMDWIERGLGDLATRTRSPVTSGYGSEMLHGNTHASAWIKGMFAGWFSADGVKRVPTTVARSLTPLALAFWYMDDGSLGHHEDQEDRAQFATCAFDARDHEVLVAALDRLGMVGVATIYDGRRRIRLNADDAERLFLLVAPYIPPAMQRKLPERYRGAPGWLPDPGGRQYKPMLVEQVVTHSGEDDDASSSSSFDLETETHNYFASDVLVHNSARYTYNAGRLYCGSRTAWKDPLGGPIGGVPGAPKREHAWWNVARRLGLEEKLRARPDVGVFGEVYGDARGMKYNATSDARGLVLFDAMTLKTRTYLDYEDFIALAAELQLPTAPLLYRGPWRNDLRSLAEGDSTLAKHVREGVVIKPVRERFDARVGRVILKLHGEGFHLRG